MMYVIIVTPNNFPEGDAGAVRDGCFAKLYNDLGYNVIHIGMNPNVKKGTWNNVKFFSLYEKHDSIGEKLRSNRSYEKRLLDLVSKIESYYGKPSIIHIYDIPESGIKWAKEQGIKRKIPIIHDSVEWYSPCEFKYGRLSYPYILKDRTNRKLIDKPISVIAISSYLETYFKDKGLSVIRIPVIMDSRDYTPKNRENDRKIKLVYAGSPAKKDYLAECITAFSRLPVDKKGKFEFRIFGADDIFVKSCCDDTAHIKAYGRVPRNEVVSNLEGSDFSLLLRPEKERYTMAGFPTKSVEAMMTGCVLICNLTSDLGMYLRDGKNSIVVRDSTSDEMYKALLRISDLTNDEIEDMKINARYLAEQEFDYRKYVNILKDFVQSRDGKKD